MEAPARALILAAGVGSRLRPLTDELPKALVQVGGVSLLERLLQVCSQAGLREAVVVSGHASDHLERWLAERPLPIAVTTVFNPQYATLNNAHSVLVAREALQGESFVQLDGDLLLHVGIVEALLAAPWPSAVALDQEAALDDEAMKAAVDETGRVTALGKWLTPEQGAGEAIGAAKIAADDGVGLFEAIERIVHREGRGEAYYEDVFHSLLEEGWRLGASDTSRLPWAEIDTAEDLMQAKRQLAKFEP